MDTSSGVGVNGRYYGAEWGRNDNDAAGATVENAEGVISSLILTNLAGHDSHGGENIGTAERFVL